MARKQRTPKLYKARAGSGLSDEDAEIVGARLTVLADGKAVSAKRILDDARPQDSPLHRFFEWDNAKAAEAYRLNQARQLARSITVTIIRDRREEQSRAFHAVRFEGARGYISSAVVFSRGDLAAQVVGRAAEELQGWINRYRSYTALAKAIETVNEAIVELTVD